MANQGVPGLAVGLATVGGVLVWSAIRNVTPVDTLREVLGRPSESRPISTPFASTTSGVRNVGKAVGEAVADAAPAGASALAARLVQEARKLIGVPYVWAAASPTGVDCSGLVVLCLRRSGVNAPRFVTGTFGTWAKSQGWAKVPAGQFRTGDVILRTGHMGIAVSATRLIHAPTVGQKVTEAAIWQPGNWWGWRPPGGSTATLSDRPHAGQADPQQKKAR